MNNYIDSLLSYKNQRYNEEASQTVDKTNTKDYLDSCIVFVYDKQNKNITSFLKELEKLDYQKFQDDEKKDKNNQINSKDNDQKNNLLSELGDIMVISSDICGLGKSEYIKN